MTNWRELAVALKKHDYSSNSDSTADSTADPVSWLQVILSDNPVITDPREYSNFFKFLLIAVKVRTFETFPIVIKRIIKEWEWIKHLKHVSNNDQSRILLFQATVSFLIHLKKATRKEFFRTEIVHLWMILFSETIEGDLYPKLFLVREYRRELSFNWLLDYVAIGGPENENVSSSLFYNVHFNEYDLDVRSQAAIDILIELLEKAKMGDHEEGDNNEDDRDDLRVSGVLEKIGSLWKANSLMNPIWRGKILKLLALASFISAAANNIFDSLPALMELLSSLSHEQPPSSNIWLFRLVESIMKKYPVKQYVLSQSRAELSQISGQLIKICVNAVRSVTDDESAVLPICGMMRSVLERWDSLTGCPIEIENEFVETVETFLNDGYSKMLEHTQLSISFNLHFELLSVFIKYFVDLLKPKLVLFFRNALKYSAIQSDTKSFIILNTVTSLLVEDGGTDTAFKQLFIDHPSLVSDIHTLIDVVDAKYSDNSSVSVWLMCLIGSPRTKEVLIDFLVDPEQIIQLKSDPFWMNFFNTLLKEESDVRKIFDWTNGKLVSEFYRRNIRESSNIRDTSIIENLFNLPCFREHEKFPEILKMCKNDTKTLGWILSNISSVSEIETVLLEMTPFGDTNLAKTVFGMIRKNLMEPGELIDVIFSKTVSIDCLYQWNLWTESGKLEYSNDEEYAELPSTDYGGYLEDLFNEISSISATLVKESDDIVEMYLEYYKYGHVRSMKIIQSELLKRFKCTELLVRIPLIILKSGGKDFGQRILDEILKGGMDVEDMGIIKGANDNMLDNLRDYYKNRLINKL